MRRTMILQDKPIVIQVSKPECSLTMFGYNGACSIDYYLGWDTKTYNRDDVKELGTLISELKRMKKTMEKYV